ncbi:hypothetical protein D3C76_1540070 [compost metagenome]
MRALAELLQRHWFRAVVGAQKHRPDRTQALAPSTRRQVERVTDAKGGDQVHSAIVVQQLQGADRPPAIELIFQ